MNKRGANEILSLNHEDLDVEELEHRLELAATVSSVEDWPCLMKCDPLCGANKPPPAK